jgi:hypothetical protein
MIMDAPSPVAQVLGSERIVELLPGGSELPV